MFIKRDHRPIAEILSDNNQISDILRLSKRYAEFQGNVQVLVRYTQGSERWKAVKVLNLYDNNLKDIKELNIITAECDLQELNLGCNRLMQLPVELHQIQGIKRLWLDDNEFKDFPSVVCRLIALESLRLSNNLLTTVPDLINNLQNLVYLALDNNQLEDLPQGLFQLNHLQHLHLRQNRLSVLSDRVEELEALETLSMSSNRLVSVPSSLGKMKRLRVLGLNSNRLVTVPVNVFDGCSLECVNLSCNPLDSDSNSWLHDSTKLVWQSDESALEQERASASSRALYNQRVIIKLTNKPVM